MSPAQNSPGKKVLRILNVIDVPWHSALAAYAFDQSAALAALGHTVLFAAPEDSAAAAFAREKSFPLTIIPPRRDHFIFGALLRLKKLVDFEHIDVVNAHTGRAQTIAWLLSLICSGRFAVIRTKADAKRPSNNFTLGRTVKVIAGSKVIREMYLTAGLEAGKVEVIYQGIPADVSGTPHPGSRNQGSPVKVGILGRLDPVKGHECFIDAAALVLKKAPGTEFIIAGREENVRYSALEARAERLGIRGHIKYLGHVTDAMNFVRSCDIGVIPSLGSEAVSRAALEWLAAGRPLIASDTGSLPEFVEKEWLVPPRDPAALAWKLISLLASPEEMTALGARNKEKASKDFDPAAFAGRTERAFLEAADEVRNS